MSISVDELLYETFTLRLEKDTRFNYSSIPLENRIMFLRSAEAKLINKYYGENNIYKLGFEAFKKRIDDLQILVVPSSKLSLRRDTTSRYFKYIADLSTLTDYNFYITSYITATKQACKNRIITNLLSERSDINTILMSEFNTPSFEWQEQPVTLANNKVEIYTDGTYNPEYLYLDYIKYPPKIDIEGYVDFNGNVSVTQNSVLPEYLKNDLVDIACELVAMSQENQLQTNFAQQRIKTDE
jgi:hypothetical protein